MRAARHGCDNNSEIARHPLSQVAGGGGRRQHAEAGVMQRKFSACCLPRDKLSLCLFRTKRITGGSGGALN